ncbi:hypothetical protein ACSBR2_010249 [Camellia fascicularis]
MARISQGGFGVVYKGFIDDGAVTVSIKRMNAESKQGVEEFWTEIKTLSNLRHLHVVTLIGYSNDYEEMEQRLNICIGAACGLDYLHTNTKPSVRDVKTTNILLDENLVAKILDFGLSKISTTNYTHISTNVKSTFSHLDLEYFFIHRLTKKSDVYAFGMVLFEVLCVRLPVDTRVEEQCSLVL